MFEELLEELKATGIPFEAYAWEVAPKVDYGTLSIVGGGDVLMGDNKVQEQAIMVICDFFTRGASTSKPRIIQETLQNFDGCQWRLDSVQYETETRLVHWHWDIDLRRL